MRSMTVLIALLSFICIGCQPAQKSEIVTDTPIPDEEVISLLEEFIAEREIQIKRLEGLTKERLLPPDHVAPARADLAETRIELAKRLGQQDKVVEQLEFIVSTLEKAETRTELLIKLGESHHADQFAARQRLLQTRIRLVEEKAKL